MARNTAAITLSLLLAIISSSLLLAKQTETKKKLDKVPFRISQLKMMLRISDDGSQKPSIELSKNWPKSFNGLFQGIRVDTPHKVSSLALHQKAVASIPKELMKGYHVSSTREIDGWYFSSIDKLTTKDSQWMHLVATKKGESFLQFGFTW